MILHTNTVVSHVFFIISRDPYCPNMSFMIPSWLSWSSHESHDQHMIFHDLHISSWSFACSALSPHEFITSDPTWSTWFSDEYDLHMIIMLFHMIRMILTRILWSLHDLYMDSRSPHNPHDPHTNLMLSTWSSWSSHDPHDTPVIVTIPTRSSWTPRKLKCDPTLYSSSFLPTWSSNDSLLY